MRKFKYKILEIDYAMCKITVRYWTEGMTFYNGNQQIIKFYVDDIKNLTLHEFDKFIYERVEDDFKNLVKRLQEYKDGKFDVIEKISNTVRTLDVV